MARGSILSVSVNDMMKALLETNSGSMRELLLCSARASETVVPKPETGESAYIPGPESVKM